MSNFTFNQTGGVTSFGLLSSTEDDRSDLAKSTLVLSSQDATGIYNLLKQAAFESDHLLPEEEGILSQTFRLTENVGTHKYTTKVSGLGLVGEFKVTQSRLLSYVKSALLVDGAPKSISRVVTSLEVEGFSSKNDFKKALKPSVGSQMYPKSVRFTLRRTVVTASLEESPTGKILKVEASGIAKLLFALDFSTVYNQEKFKLSYSSSMCFVTDSAAAKYERINDPEKELNMLPIMFTLPLQELSRLSIAASRPRVQGFPTPEVLLTNFVRSANPEARLFSHIDWEKWWESPLTEKLKFPFFHSIELSSLALATRLHGSSSVFGEEELQAHLRRIVAYITSIFTSRYQDKGGFSAIVGRAKVIQSDKFEKASIPDEVLIEEMSGSQQYAKGVKLEVFDKSSELRKLYELNFRLFDVNKITRELDRTQDVKAFHENVHLNTRGDDHDFPFESLTKAIRSTGHKILDSALDLHLLITRRALVLNPSSPGTKPEYDRSTAAGLIRFIMENGGMDAAFMEDFRFALVRSGVNYWFAPEKWSVVMHSPAAFVRKASEMGSSQLPGHYQVEPETLDYVLNVAKYIMSCPEEKLQGAKLQEIQDMFPLETVRIGSNPRKDRIRKLPYLMILTFALMSRKKKLSLLDALESAPFLSDKVKEEFKLKGWRYSSCRKRTVLVDELVELFIKHLNFNPRYSYGIHEVNFRNLHDIFLREEDQPSRQYESSASESLTQMIEKFSTTQLRLLPEFRQGLRQIVSPVLSHQSAKLKAYRR